MKKLLGMLGLAKRAGKVSTGTFICEKMIKSKTAKLIILAKDASDNTSKSIKDACNYHKIKLVLLLLILLIISHPQQKIS